MSKQDVIYHECRDIGHSWLKQGKPTANAKDVERRLLCPNCKTERIDVISSKGLVSRRYYYADGYLYKGQRVTKQQMRVLVYRLAKGVIRG